MNFNKVLIAGNLTRDPELKYTPSGTAVCQIGLAVNRRWKDANGETKEEVFFCDCNAFGKTAENIAQYLKKGRCVFIEGRLKRDEWQDKQSGEKRSATRIVVETCQFIGGAKDDDAPRPVRPTQALQASAQEATEDSVPF